MNEYATVPEIKELIKKLSKTTAYGKKDLLYSLKASLEYAEQGIKISKAPGTTFAKASNAVFVGGVDQDVEATTEDE